MYNEVMITENIIVAVVTGIFATIGVVVSNVASNRKNSVEQAKRDQKLEDKIQSLSNRVDIHNGYAEKFAESTTSINLLQKDIEYIKGETKELKDIPLCKVK